MRLSCAGFSVSFTIVRDALKIFKEILFLVLYSREIGEGCFGEVQAFLNSLVTFVAVLVF